MSILIPMGRAVFEGVLEVRGGSSGGSPAVSVLWHSVST